MDTPPPSSRTLLSSWKEIAAYLKVDVRTAQRWDKKRPMPIHRFVTGERSHPYMYADDLDRWRADADPGGDETPSGGGSTPEASTLATVPGDAGEPAVRAPWRPPRRLVAVVAAIAVVAASLGVFVLRGAGDPASARLDGTRLIVLDADGRTCFTRDIAEFADGESTGNPPTHDDWIIEDADGDGHTEVLVNVPATIRGNTTGRLASFDRRGRLVWQFAYGKARAWEGREFSAKYRGRLIGVFSARGQRYVVGVAWHHLWFPAQVVLLDARSGALLDEYWHPGAVYEAFPRDLDGDGEPELLLGGLSNPGLGLGHAGLVALSVPFSTPPAKQGGMSGFTGGREFAYLAFPRSDVCAAEGLYPYVTLLEADKDDHVVLRIQCGDVSFHYTLDRGLGLVDARVSDNVPARHAQLERRGILSHTFDAAERACLAQVHRSPTVVNGNDAALFAQWSRCE